MPHIYSSRRGVKKFESLQGVNNLKDVLWEVLSINMTDMEVGLEDLGTRDSFENHR